MAFSDLLEDVAKAFEAIGAAVLVIGLAWSVVLAARRWRTAGGRSAYQALRETFGAVLLTAETRSRRPRHRQVLDAVAPAAGSLDQRVCQEKKCPRPGTKPVTRGMLPGDTTEQRKELWGRDSNSQPTG
jgi:hypothetical protein